ncbi:hypothetical protein LUZ60_009932 [Juncus effusus]|nr:hypothetical protein LUZ60_009932 [Juncus effusus]
MESVPSSGAMGGYPDSIDSSPRSRGGESWDEPYPSSHSRLRLMCSYGGRIVPRPTDKSLCYLGGETRIVVVDRNSSLSDLHSKLSRTLLGGCPFSLKYQLPNEDLDSLISVSTDEDLENMVDEYDRILSQLTGGGSTGSTGGGSSRTSRIRLFLFPSKPDSASSMGSMLDDSTKSETWFVDALNNAMIGTIDGLPRGMSADSTSVNCLLGLEDDSSTHSRPAVPAVSGGAGDQKLARPDVHSVPDSPMLDKSSSFGSTSSAPSLSNLPPIRVRPDDRPPDHRTPTNIEDHFAHMNLAAQPEVAAQPVQVPFQTHLPPPIIPTPPTSVPNPPAFSPSENPNRVISDDERSDHGAGSHRPQQPKPTETPLSDQNSRPVYYQERTSNEQLKPISNENTYRITVPVQEQPPPNYMYPQMTHQPPIQQQTQQPTLPHQQPTPHQQTAPHQQQQQFIQANPQYLHHPPSGTYVPVPSYFPQQSHPFDPPQQIPTNMPMYYVPVRQNPNPYNLAPVPSVPSVPNVQAVPAKTAGQVYPAGMGYHLMQPNQMNQMSQMSQMSQSPAGFGYEFADPGRVYYSQAGTNNVSPNQYQTVVTQQISEPVQELKQHRPS